MSRSRRHGKGPRVASGRLSEADDKADAARRLRQKAKRALTSPPLVGKVDPEKESEEPDLPERPREVSDRWGFTKDA
jgi:hypothetical protein